ncbi:MAG: hypothetical protein RLZZ232_2188 [Planctomycetota bacterium]|jgi:prepilin-type N-terminal cleavage/methylation domain-containing protein
MKRSDFLLNSLCRGFTIVELLVVSAIISILFALILPSVQSARESARMVQCRNNLHQLCLAIHQYESTFGVFPPGMQVHPLRGSNPNTKSVGWTIALLSYLGRADLYSDFDFNLDAQIYHRHLTKHSIAAFMCPSDPNAGQTTWGPGLPATTDANSYTEGPWGTTNYLGVSGVNWFSGVKDPTECASVARTEKGRGVNDGVLFGNSSVSFGQITDGSSNTWLFGERGVVPGTGKWGGAGVVNSCPNGGPDVLNPGVAPRESERGGIQRATGVLADARHWWSWHGAGTHFASADGSIRLFSYSTAKELQQAYSTRAGNESVVLEW